VPASSLGVLMACVNDEKKGLAASLQQAPLFSSVKPG
jgi:hypothetical protein